MSAGGAVALPLPGGRSHSSTLATQVGSLAGRSVMRTLRQPAMIVPSLIFPLFLLAVNSAGLSAATQIPGFPTDSYLTFVLAFPFVQGALFATMNSGQALAEDIENGFFNRLSLTPMRGSALIAGQLASLIVIGLIQATVYLSVGLAAGAHFAAGPLGVPVLFALTIMITIGFGGLGMFMAIRSGSGEAVQGMFPLLFILLFFSSISLPRNLIQEQWFRTVATINPVSYLVEGIRSLLIYGWDLEALALAFGIAAALIAFSITISSMALRGRMARS
jgi:ABC-2 type transport system permease protein